VKGVHHLEMTIATCKHMQSCCLVPFVSWNFHVPN